MSTKKVEKVKLPVLNEAQKEWLLKLPEEMYLVTDKSHTVACRNPLWCPIREEYTGTDARFAPTVCGDEDCECESCNNRIELVEGKTCMLVKDVLDTWYPERNKLQNLNTVACVKVTGKGEYVLNGVQVTRAEVVDGKLIVEVR